MDYCSDAMSSRPPLHACSATQRGLRDCRWRMRSSFQRSHIDTRRHDFVDPIEKIVIAQRIGPWLGLRYLPVSMPFASGLQAIMPMP